MNLKEDIMTKKAFTIGTIMILFFSIALGFTTYKVGAALPFKSDTSTGFQLPTSSNNLIVGNWVENGTEVDVTFKDNGVFQIMGNDTANYELDSSASTITLTYAEALGGQVITMNYVFSDDNTKLTLTDTSTNTDYIYIKN